MRKIRLVHPGELLLKEFIKPNRLTVYRVARDARIPQSTLQLIVSGKRSIGAETALRLGVYFQIDAQFWLNLQSEYELRLAKEAKLVRIQREVRPLRKAA